MSNRRLPVFLRGAEPDELIAAALTPRDRLLFQIGLYAGMRVSEIVGLRAEHIDFDEGTIMVVQGKGDKDRLIPIPSKLITALRRWLGDDRTGYVFPASRMTHGATGHLSVRSAQRVVKAAAAEAGITRPVTPHKLRHTYATRLLRTGANLREVQELLGHASVATTEVYTHVVLDDRLKATVERL